MAFVLTFPSVGTFGVSGTCGDLVSFDTTITVDAVEGIFSGTLAARIYDATTHALIASGPSTVVSGTSSPNKLPLSSPVVLTAGTTYMLGFYVVSSGTSGYDTSSGSVSAGGVAMSTPGGSVSYSTNSDAYPSAANSSSYRWPVGVEAAVGGGGTPASASGSLVLAGTASTAARMSAAGTLVLAGSATGDATAAASGALVLAGSAAASAAFTLTVTPSGASALLSWTAAASSYVVQRDGSNVAWGVTGTSYTDLPPAGEHTYRVGVLG